MDGAKAHPDTEDCYEDAVDREDKDATVDTADEENCQVDDDQSQESQSVDGSVVKGKAFPVQEGSATLQTTGGTTGSKCLLHPDDRDL